MTSKDNGQNTALLIMDLQVAIVNMLSDSKPFLQSVASAAETARTHKIPVIYIALGFRKGYPEVSRNNRSFSTIKKNQAFSHEINESTQIHPEITPKSDEIVIIKKRVSAFTGSDLEVVLRSLGIKHLILSGIATSGVVLSTLREAADKDYQITVLSDCCTDRDEEVHRVLIEKVFPKQAEVLTLQQWTRGDH